MEETCVIGMRLARERPEPTVVLTVIELEEEEADGLRVMEAGGDADREEGGARGGSEEKECVLSDTAI